MPSPPARNSGVTWNLVIIAVALCVGVAGARLFVRAKGPAPAKPMRELSIDDSDFSPPAETATSVEGPRPSSDVWCEGLPVERCGEFPDVCHKAAYCDGEPFCTARPGEQTPKCGGEGYFGAQVACCPGLVARCGRKQEDGTCDAEHGTEQRPQCMPCGDGVCGPMEQRCNCPEDCAVTPERQKIVYRGSQPDGPGKGEPTSPSHLTRPGQCLDVQGDAARLHRCMGAWARAVLGRDSLEELRHAASIAPFTPFDLELMGCLELRPRGRPPEEGPSREACLEALSLRTKDGRLDTLLRP